MSDAAGAKAQLKLGLKSADNGWYAKAVDCFRAVVELEPANAAVYLFLATALIELDRLDEAKGAIDSAINQARGDATVERMIGPALAKLGGALRKVGRITEAGDCFAAAAERDPDDALAHLRCGIISLLQGHPELALPAFERSVKLDPTIAQSWHNLGVALTGVGRIDEAIAALTRALELRPDHLNARAQRMFLLARNCDWALLDEDLARVREFGASTGAVSPFMMLSFEDHPARHRQRAENYVAALCPQVSPVPPPPTVRPEKLSLGYFSADFRNHATVHLAGRIFELHDRDRFNVHAYSFGPPTDDLSRRRMIRAFDSFTDVSAMSDDAVVAKARADGIDVAIDLLGHTEGSRIGIFARRAAPVQVNWLGYPGTSGASFIDYMVADPMVVADEHRLSYCERLITLPFSYQPSDDRRMIAARPSSRADVGLPDQAFVFCCFNNSYKLKPVEFAIWMRLLKAIDASLLWLAAGPVRSQDNLRAAALQHGVDPERLVFAESRPVAEHLARCRLADLFVDTFHYNAHTTASDALWAGLPLITMAGQGFATRVAASLLHAVGLDELITTTEEAYFDLALELARDPVKLAAIRAKLAANRLALPLFDSERFTRHIEAGYQAAYRTYFEGRPPGDIRIDP